MIRSRAAGPLARLRRMRGRALALSAAAALSAVGVPAEAQRVALDERGLDGVTASSALVIGAGAVLESESEVRVEDDAQRGLRAVNAVNAAGSDTAQALNVMTAEGFAAEIDQSNAVSQTASRRREAAHFSTPGPAIERESRATRALERSADTVRLSEDADRRVISRRTTTRFDATVEPRRVGFFDEPMSLGAPSVELPQFGVRFEVPVKFSIADLPGDLFDIDVDRVLSLSANVDDATLDLGDVTLHDDDILIASPVLTLPDMQFGICFLSSDCADDGSTDAAVTIPGGEFSLGDVELTGANPLGDLGIDFGYAVAGDGTISVDAGSVSVSGSIPLVDLVLDVPFGLEIEEADFVTDFVESLELPDFEIPVNGSLDLPVPDGFNRELASQACTFSQAAEGCTPLDVTTEETVYVDRSSRELRRSESVGSEARYDFEASRHRGALEVRTGQSDVTVLRGASAEADRYSVVIVGGGAQSAIAAVNAVNAAAAIVGNGVNVVTIAGPPRARPAHAPRRGVSQANAFEQIGGL